MSKLLTFFLLTFSFQTYASFCGNDKVANLAVTEEKAREMVEAQELASEELEEGEIDPNYSEEEEERESFGGDELES